MAARKRTAGKVARGGKKTKAAVAPREVWITLTPAGELWGAHPSMAAAKKSLADGDVERVAGPYVLAERRRER